MGIGAIVALGAVYGWIEGLPPLTSLKHELFVSELIGFSFIAFGWFLTWPRTRLKKFRKVR